jgi:hypothetical protein
MKICPLGREWLDVDGRTDEDYSLFFNIASAPKKRVKRTKLVLLTPQRHRGEEDV